MMASPASLMSIGSATWVVPTSQSMRAIEKIVAEIAGTDIPVLLIGESGTGKEVLARRIHALSHLREKPFAKINCGLITADRLSADLAGHWRSDGGRGQEETSATLLFDELGDLDSTCQARLLYALPDGESVPETETIASRVISATTRELEDETRTGRFRRELYYRLNGVCLRLPRLRDRREDIPALAEFLLTKHASQLGRSRPSLRPESLQALVNHGWPGNIRELENVMRKIVALNNEQGAISELRSSLPSSKMEPPATRAHSLKAAARAASREAERGLILETLARTHWNRKRAAQELQISYKTLLYKLKQIGIEESERN